MTSMSEYSGIAQTASSRLRAFEAWREAGKPWTVQNVLPWPVRLMYLPPYGADAASVAEIGPRATRAVVADAKGRPIAPGGFITANAADGRVVSGPYQLVGEHKTLAVGSALYDDGGFGENFFNLQADLAGVHFTNHFPFGVQVWYKDNLVGEMGPGTGLEYFSNSTAQIYFDNAGAGLRLGDVLTIRAGHDLLYNLTLNDTHIQTIHLGVTAAQ